MINYKTNTNGFDAANCLLVLSYLINASTITALQLQSIASHMQLTIYL